MKNGKLYENTSPKYNGEEGSMSVFAPAEDIVVPGDPNVPNTGTSQAAAIVVSAHTLCSLCFAAIPRSSDFHLVALANFT